MVEFVIVVSLITVAPVARFAFFNPTVHIITTLLN